MLNGRYIFIHACISIQGAETIVTNGVMRLFFGRKYMDFSGVMTHTIMLVELFGPLKVIADFWAHLVVIREFLGVVKLG